MPDNDLDRRLARIEQQFGLTTTNNQQVSTNNDTNPIEAIMPNRNNSNINWCALYKWLESEVEEVVLDPNAPQFVKDWARRLISEAHTKLNIRL